MEAQSHATLAMPEAAPPPPASPEIARPERTSARLALLQSVTAAVSGAEPVPLVARAAVESLARALDATAATLRLLRADGTLELLAESGAPASIAAFPPRVALDAPLPIAFAARCGEPVWLESRAAIEARFPALLAGASDRLAACAAVPLAIGERTIGGVALAFDAPQRLDVEERAFVLALAEHCAQALDGALLRADERERAAQVGRARDRMEHLQVLTAALSSARSVDDVLRAIVVQARDTLGMDSALALVLPRGTETAMRSAAGGIAASYEAALLRAGLDAPAPEAVAARTGEGFWLESRDAVRAAFPRLAAELPGADALRAIGALPLRVRGAIAGAVAIGLTRERRFHPDERRALASAAEQCALALERAELYDSERRLREETERAKALLDAIFENAPIGMALFDRDLRIARVNPRLAELVGVPAAAPVGKRIRDILPLVPHEQAEATAREVISSGHPILDVELSGETPALPGKLRWAMTSWFPVTAAGEVLGVGALVREVTAEREAAEFQRNVLGIVGHDLRNPLAAIVTSVLLWRRAGTADADARRAGRILANASRMGRIIDVLVDYTRVRAGHGIPIQPRRCDLAEICRGVVEECEASHAGRSVAAGGDADATGEWDPDRIGQVIANLLSNALDYSPPASAVELTWRVSPHEVAVEISNEGPPIPAELLPRIFEPFRRAEASGARRRGAGLGLFIASAIARAHGGHIDVRSAPGERTVFVLTLPRAR